MVRNLSRALCLLLLVLSGHPASAHHIIGRPAYNLNEDSNTPPSMEVEAQIGAFDTRYMVFPAFPRPDQTGRINLYITALDDGSPFTGTVAFSIRRDSLFSKEEDLLGHQLLDDKVFRQNFRIREPGDYIVTAKFSANGEPYVIDFPLHVGGPSSTLPLSLAIGILILFLGGISIIQRHRLARKRISLAHDQDRP